MNVNTLLLYNRGALLIYLYVPFTTKLLIKKEQVKIIMCLVWTGRVLLSVEESARFIDGVTSK